MSTFDGRLREVLRRLHLTAAGAAERVGTSPANISRWSDGTVEPKIGQAADLARGLGVSVGWLVAGQGPMWAAEIEASPEAAVIRELVYLEMADFLRERAVAIATGHAEPLVEPGIEGGPLRPAVVRTMKERLAADADAIQTDARIRRRPRPPE